MSFPCHRCNSILSSQRRLDEHQTKKVPCDFVCKICDVKSATYEAYRYHLRSKHPNPSVTSESKAAKAVVDTIEPEEDKPLRIRVKKAQETPLIPLQDFDRAYLDELVNIATEIDSEITLEIKLTVRPRAQKAVERLGFLDFANSLQCFGAHGVGPDSFNKVAAGVLENLHGDPSRPDLHIIKMGDFVRKNVNIFSRPSDEEPARWLPYAKDAALKQLSKHMSAIIPYTFTKASGDLVPKFSPSDDFICFAYNDNTMKRTIIITFADETGMNQTQLDVKYYDQELKDYKLIPDRHRKNIKLLCDVISDKIPFVLKQIRLLQFTEEDVMPFLEKTRRPITENLT